MSSNDTINSMPETTAQDRFDSYYITSTEIARRMRVAPPTVLNARRRGTLPDPIVVNSSQIYLWEREVIEPYLQAWDLSLRSRKGELRKGNA